MLEKKLQKKHLIILRRGEPATDNVLNQPILLGQEILKIKTKTSTPGECLFLDPSSKLCTIHEQRPLECSLLECWNPRPLMESYQSRRLTRKDLFQPESAMEEIVDMHEEHCSVLKMARLLREEIQEPGKNREAIQSMISFDRSLRQNFQDKTGLQDSEMLFYFGRPLQDLMQPLSTYLRKYQLSTDLPE